MFDVAVTCRGASGDEQVDVAVDEYGDELAGSGHHDSAVWSIGDERHLVPPQVVRVRPGEQDHAIVRIRNAARDLEIARCRVRSGGNGVGGAAERQHALLRHAAALELHDPLRPLNGAPRCVGVTHADRRERGRADGGWCRRRWWRQGHDEHDDQDRSGCSGDENEVASAGRPVDVADRGREFGRVSPRAFVGRKRSGFHELEIVAIPNGSVPSRPPSGSIRSDLDRRFDCGLANFRCR